MLSIDILSVMHTTFTLRAQRANLCVEDQKKKIKEIKQKYEAKTCLDTKCCITKTDRGFILVSLTSCHLLTFQRNLLSLSGLVYFHVTSNDREIVKNLERLGCKR